MQPTRRRERLALAASIVGVLAFALATVANALEGKTIAAVFTGAAGCCLLVSAGLTWRAQRRAADRSAQS